MKVVNTTINRAGPIISLRTSLAEIKSLLERHERIQERFPFKLEKTRGQKACDAIEQENNRSGPLKHVLLVSEIETVTGAHYHPNPTELEWKIRLLRAAVKSFEAFAAGLNDEETFKRAVAGGNLELPVRSTDYVVQLDKEEERGIRIGRLPDMLRNPGLFFLYFYRETYNRVIWDIIKNSPLGLVGVRTIVQKDLRSTSPRSNWGELLERNYARALLDHFLVEKPIFDW